MAARLYAAWLLHDGCCVLAGSAPGAACAGWPKLLARLQVWYGGGVQYGGQAGSAVTPPIDAPGLQSCMRSCRAVCDGVPLPRPSLLRRPLRSCSPGHILRRNHSGPGRRHHQLLFCPGQVRGGQHACRQGRQPWRSVSIVLTLGKCMPCVPVHASHRHQFPACARPMRHWQEHTPQRRGALVAAGLVPGHPVLPAMLPAGIPASRWVGGARGGPAPLPRGFTTQLLSCMGGHACMYVHTRAAAAISSCAASSFAVAAATSRCAASAAAFASAASCCAGASSSATPPPAWWLTVAPQLRRALCQCPTHEAGCSHPPAGWHVPWWAMPWLPSAAILLVLFRRAGCSCRGLKAGAVAGGVRRARRCGLLRDNSYPRWPSQAWCPCRRRALRCARKPCQPTPVLRPRTLPPVAFAPWQTQTLHHCN